MIPNLDSALGLALSLQAGLPPGATSALVGDLSGAIAVAAALLGAGLLMVLARRRVRPVAAVASRDEMRKAA